MKLLDPDNCLLSAIYGYNFCRAAMKAFQLLVRLIFNPQLLRTRFIIQFSIHNY